MPSKKAAQAESSPKQAKSTAKKRSQKAKSSKDISSIDRNAFDKKDLIEQMTQRQPEQVASILREMLGGK